MSTKVKRLIESIMEEFRPESSISDDMALPQDRVLQTVRDNHIDADAINNVVDEGIRILNAIRKSCNLIPVNIDFIEKQAVLYFPTSGREEAFTFAEIQDLIDDFADNVGGNALIDGIEEEDEEAAPAVASAASAASTGSAGAQPNKTVDNSATDELTKAINSATGLLNTPDEKLASLSKSTNVDLIGMKQKASQLIQKAGQSTIADIAKSAEKVAAASKNGGSSSTMNSIQP